MRIPRAAAVISAAAAHDLNDELTVIINSAIAGIEALEDDHPVRPLILDLLQAAYRVTWKSYHLLNYSSKHGIRPTAISLEKLLALLRVRRLRL